MGAESTPGEDPQNEAGLHPANGDPGARTGKQSAAFKKLKRELEEAKQAAEKDVAGMWFARYEARIAAAKQAEVQEDMEREEEQASAGCVKHGA